MLIHRCPVNSLSSRGPSPPEDPPPQGAFSSRGPSPPEDLLSPGGDSPCTPGHPLPQGAFSRLSAIHLVSPDGDSPCLAAQFTLYPRAPSPPEDPLSPDGDSPCLAAQFTLSRLTAIHLVAPGVAKDCSSFSPREKAGMRVSKINSLPLIDSLSLTLSATAPCVALALTSL